ncbi:MAG TPA: undecaprenyl-diphosphate phosphatase [Mycobacteriales bacterium]|nr:undecaprenyl-diphosphate phosphatase [Mycobacteriales bacterium]
MSALSWTEAAVVGAMQGVAELFPVSSLGHSVLLPALIGGRWARDLDVSKAESPYLAFIVGLHVATALALLLYFRRDWARIIRGLFSSIGKRKVETPDERLAWLLVLATIPVGLTGLLLEHTFRTVLAKPMPTAAFLCANGVLLLVVEQRRRAAGAEVSVQEAPLDERETGIEVDRRLASLSVTRTVAVGATQIAALAPGISRSGIAFAGGLRAGLDHEEAARFSFLLATPVILAAGVLKLPDLTGPLGNGIRGQVLLGSALSGVGAYLSVALLVRWFRSRSARAFGVYCLAAGAISLLVLGLR